MRILSGEGGIFTQLAEFKLKDSVEVSKLDSSYETQQYYLTCEGRHWQIHYILYKLINDIKSQKSNQEFIDECRNECNVEINEEDINKIIEGFLKKRGLLINTQNTIKKKSKTDNLWFKIPILSSNIVEKFEFLKFMYNKPVVIINLLFNFIMYVLAIMYFNDVNISLISLTKMDLSGMGLFLFVTLFAIFFHEFGHMSYLIKENLKVGNIGFAIYYISPVFYSDVSTAWKMKRKKRMILDIGGIYFQTVFLAVAGLLGIVTNNNNLVLVFAVGTIQIIYNFNPFLKMDGYWFISDWLGIPNLYDKVQNFMINILYICLGMEYNKNFLKKINKREKRIFVVYAICSVIYMTVFMTIMVKLCIYSSSSLYSEAHGLFNKGFNIKIVNFIKENYVLFFSVILEIRVIAKLLKRVYTIMKIVIETVLIKLSIIKQSA